MLELANTVHESDGSGLLRRGRRMRHLEPPWHAWKEDGSQPARRNRRPKSQKGHPALKMHPNLGKPVRDSARTMNDPVVGPSLSVIIGPPSFLGSHCFSNAILLSLRRRQRKGSGSCCAHTAPYESEVSLQEKVGTPCLELSGSLKLPYPIP